MLLTKSQLLERVLHAVEAGEHHAILVNRLHPFLVRVFRGEERDTLDLRTYIWNCTHGGKNRAPDEYRVQLTGVVPRILNATERTLLLGWHEELRVFVGFDISRHAGQSSSSPSIQVKEETLMHARDRGFAAYDRANGEVAIAFRPEFLVDYARQLTELHRPTAQAAPFIEVLNDIGRASDQDIHRVPEAARREVLATIRRKYREQDFRFRVLGAYGHRCAMCGLQLSLVEAAHIIPVASEGSTDETCNGVALCGLHHKAFDQGLVSFDEHYVIEVSAQRVAVLAEAGLLAGEQVFRTNLKQSILLPANPPDRPSRACIRTGRTLRKWNADVET